MRTEPGYFIFLRRGFTTPDMKLQKRDVVEGLKIAGQYVTHEETSVSGEVFMQVINNLKKMRPSIVVCWRLDCLGPVFSDVSGFFELLYKITSSGHHFISLRDGLDTRRPANDFLKSAGPAVELFRERMKAERTHVGLSQAKAKGVRIGRPTVGDPAKILELRKSGLSKRAISFSVGVSWPVVSRVLKQAGAE